MSSEAEYWMERDATAEVTPCSCGLAEEHSVRQHWALEEAWNEAVTLEVEL